MSRAAVMAPCHKSSVARPTRTYGFHIPITLSNHAWLVVQAIRQARRGLALGGPWPRAMAVGLLGLVVAFVVHGLVDAPYFKNDQALAFWALLGIQLASLRGTRRTA